jgi:hypothetical protein
LVENIDPSFCSHSLIGTVTTVGVSLPEGWISAHVIKGKNKKTEKIKSGKFTQKGKKRKIKELNSKITAQSLAGGVRRREGLLESL